MITWKITKRLMVVKLKRTFGLGVNLNWISAGHKLVLNVTIGTFCIIYFGGKDEETKV